MEGASDGTVHQGEGASKEMSMMGLCIRHGFMHRYFVSGKKTVFKNKPNSGSAVI